MVFLVLIVINCVLCFFYFLFGYFSENGIFYSGISKIVFFFSCFLIVRLKLLDCVNLCLFMVEIVCVFLLG